MSFIGSGSILDDPAQSDPYQISYISSGQHWKKHHLDHTNQTVNNEGKLSKYLFTELELELEIDFLTESIKKVST